MKLGARILKTGVTLILAIYISELLGLEPVIYSAIAATLAIQPSVYRSWQYGVEQVQANLVGATVAIIFAFFLGTHPIYLAIAVMLVIGINIKLKFERTIPLSIVTVLSIMEGGAAQDSQFLLFAFDRFLLIFIGLSSAIIVNALIYPPKYDKQLSSKLKEIGEQMTSILRITFDNDKNEKFIRRTIPSLDKELDNLWNLLKFEEESRSSFKKRLQFSSSRKLVVYKSMLETAEIGIQLFRHIEKHQNTLTNLPESLTDVFSEELMNLANYQDRIYSKFEGKINTSAIYSNTSVIESYFEIYNLTYETVNDREAFLNTITVLAIMSEYNNSLTHLDKLINSYYNHHLR